MSLKPSSRPPRPGRVPARSGRGGKTGASRARKPLAMPGWAWSGLRRAWAWLLRIPGPSARLGRWLALSAALLLVLGLSAWWLSDPRNLPVRTVKVEARADGKQVPLRHLSQAALRSEIGEFARAGLLYLDLPAARRALRELPWVREAEIRRAWPDGLRVVIYEHIPAARWQALESAGAGKEAGEAARVALLNQRGELFKVPAAEVPAELPELRGPESAREQALAYYRRLRASLAPLRLTPRRLQCDARRSWELILADGPRLRLGREIEPRALRRFIILYKQVLQARTTEISYVDLRYTNGIAVRWRSAAVKG